MPEYRRRVQFSMSSHHLLERRGAMFLLAMLYLVFVIYGSLVPLDFRPRPFDQAIAEFQQIRQLNLGIGSRADWVANILLFVPLAFFWTGVSGGRGAWPLRMVASLLVFGGCVGLSFAIEFTQLFFPPRTVSLNDIYAEALGAAIGGLWWWWMGPSIWSRVCHLPLLRGSRSLAENALWIYLALLFGYNLLPLDLTISPVEIYHKWAEGRILLRPLSGLPSAPAQQVYELVSDVLVWIPVSLLCVRSGTKSAGQAWRWAIVAALVLELLQVFIYSRVSDTTDLLTALVGALIGSRLARSGAAFSPAPRIAGSYGRFGWGLVLFIGSVAGLCLVFWYPFDFTSDRNVLRGRLSMLYGVPFRSYYYGTEFRAVTEVLHKIVFFIPAGVSLAWMRLALPVSMLRNVWSLLAVCAIVAVAFIIELGQVALPGKYPDNTDLVFESLGGLLGYAGTLFAIARLDRHESS